MRKRGKSVDTIRKTKYTVVCAYGLFAFFYFWYAQQIPYTHDDWSWGLPYGWYMWLEAPYNNRFVGNLFVVLMTHSRLAKTLIMGSSYFLVSYGLATLTGQVISPRDQRIRFLLFVISHCFLFTIDISVFRETYTWVSGFANFVISVIFFMIWIYEINNIFDDKNIPRDMTFFTTVPVFLVVIAGQLFVENIAISTTILSIYLSFVCYFRRKRICHRNIIMIFGALLGLLIMFSSDMYSVLWHDGTALDGYREIFVSNSDNLYSIFVKVVIQLAYLIPNTYANNLIICVSTLMVLSGLLIYHDYGTRTVRLSFCVANAFVILWLFLNKLTLESVSNSFFQLAIGNDIFLSLIYFLIVTIEIIYLFHKNKWYMYKMLSIWLLIPIIQLPLAVTTALGGRLFFASCVISILLILMLLKKVSDNWSEKRITGLIYIFLIVAIFLMIFYGVMITEVHDYEIDREAIIATAVHNGDDQVVLSRYPNSKFLYLPEPVNSFWENIFKLYYGIPDDVELIFR